MRLGRLEFYMGWVVQPVGENLFYLYERRDTKGLGGDLFRGRRSEALRYIDRRLKKDA